MELTQLTAAALFTWAETFIANLVREKGYTSGELYSIRITRGEIALVGFLSDDFQEKLVNDKYQVYSYDTIWSGTTSEEAFSKLNAWPSRAARELHVLAARMGTVIEMQDKIVSMAAQQFVDDVILARNQFLALEAPITETNDEIPF